MEAVSTSETSAIVFQITRRNIPEDSHLNPEDSLAVGTSWLDEVCGSAL
jgi:hypothetical protein